MIRNNDDDDNGAAERRDYRACVNLNEEMKCYFGLVTCYGYSRSVLRSISDDR